MIAWATLALGWTVIISLLFTYHSASDKVFRILCYVALILMVVSTIARHLGV